MFGVAKPSCSPPVAALRSVAKLASLSALAGRFDGPPVRPGANHYSADLAGFGLKWERHGEFVRYMVTAKGPVDDLFGAWHTPLDW